VCGRHNPTLFVIALSITELAFADPVDQSNAKLAILLASVLAAGASTAILATASRTETATAASDLR